MSPPLPPLARRTVRGVVVDERLVRVACRWPDLASRDGERIEIEWTAQVGCVDTPADRALLAERLLDAADATVEVAAIARLLVADVRPTLARLIATSDAVTLLDGSRDADLAAAIEADARRAGFAAGLRLALPFALRIDSPSVRRAQDAARARVQLDAISAGTAQRSSSVDRLRDALADPRERSHAIRAAANVDGRDVLRAVATADARWSSPTPTLWIVAGDRLLGVDATRPDLYAASVTINGIGPIRSVRAAGDGTRLVGGRDGVAVVDVDGRTTRTCPLAGGGDVGFNAACVLTATGELLATHSAHGLVRWHGCGDATIVPLGGSAGGARSVIAVGDRVAVLLDGDGGLRRVDGDGVTSIAAGASPIVALAALDENRVAIADAGRHVAIVDALDPLGGTLARTRVASPITAIAGVDLCGVPRVLVAHDDGTTTLLDVETGHATPLGDGRWPTKVIRSRPGFAAMLSVDRLRVGLLDLSRPDAAIVELHVHAQLGRRVADIWFA